MCSKSIDILKPDLLILKLSMYLRTERTKDVKSQDKRYPEPESMMVVASHFLFDDRSNNHTRTNTANAATTSKA